MAVPGGKPLVLFLGRLSYVKGMDLLAGAWPLVVRDAPTAHLVLAGADDEGLFQAFARKLSACGMGDTYTYVGIADAPRKAALLRTCSVLASPSISESFGMSIVEAMAEGKPVVVTEGVKISPSIRTAGAGLVTRHEPRDVADAIVKILRDTSLASSMGAAGKALVDDSYALPVVAQRMKDTFEDIIANHRP